MTAMAYDIPPAPRDYVPPPRRRQRSPAHDARVGQMTIAAGAVIFMASFWYGTRGGAMTSLQAFVAMFPLFLMFAAIGTAIWKQGAQGIGPMAAYLSAAVSLCGLVAYWIWGK